MKQTHPISKNKILVSFGFIFTLILIMTIKTDPFKKTIIFTFGESMQPTFSSGDLLIINKETPITQGSVVVAMVPNKVDNKEKQVCKRVVGLPEDLITVSNQELLVNGISMGSISNQNMNLDYSKRLSKKEYFLLGDNRSDSIDSCTYGPISSDAIIGVVENVKEKNTP